MSRHLDGHDYSTNARRNSTSSSSNEYEQVFQRYNYEDYKEQFQFLLNVMKDITKRTTFNVPTFPEAAKENQVDELSQIGNPPDSEGQGWLQVFGSTLNKISNELISKTKTDDEGEKASRILKALANYTMKAKVVMVLAAFSVKYGKVCLAAGLYPLNPVARAVVSLRRQHSVLERPEYLTQWHNKLAEIIKKMLQLAEQRILMASQNDAQRYGGEAVQLIIQCAIVCSSQMMAILMPDGHIRGAHEKLPEPYRWNLCVLNNALNSMLRVEEKQPEIAEELDSTKPSVEKATATKKVKNQPKSKGRSSNKLANICCYLRQMYLKMKKN